MALKWYESDSNITIDSLVSLVKTQLIANGYTDPDPGYSVVRITDTDIDIAMILEATNKRYLQFQIGHWNAGTHDMPDPKIQFGHVIADTSSGHPTGSEQGLFKLSYDTMYFILWTDYKGIAASYRRNVSYAGFAFPFASADKIVTGGSVMNRGAYAIPVNDELTRGIVRIMKDLSGSETKPSYGIGGISHYIFSSSPTINGAVRGTVYAATPDKRYMVPIWLGSFHNFPTGGEDAGFRGRLYNVYHGFGDDQEIHGQTVENLQTNETCICFQMADYFSYHNIPTRLWIRMT